MQHTAALLRPQVLFPSHPRTVLLQWAGSVWLATAAFTTVLAHLRYFPWLAAPAQSQASATSERVASTCSALVQRDVVQVASAPRTARSESARSDHRSVVGMGDGYHSGRALTTAVLT